MKNKLTHKVFIPDSLKRTISQLINDFPPEIYNFKKENLFFILSLINEAPTYNKRRGLSKKGMSSLNSRSLKHYVYNYNEYLHYLIENGIIETDNSYAPGIKSKGYKISKKYNSKLTSIYIHSPALVRKIRKDHILQQRPPAKYKTLYKSFTGLEIDFEAATRFISDLHCYRMRHPDNLEWNPRKRKYKNPTEQYNSAYIKINNLIDKRYYFYVDDNVHRLHTNITNMQSDLRNFFSWKGKHLVSIDISNSQPFLSCILFSPLFYTHDSILNDKKKDNQLTIFSFPDILNQLQGKHLQAPQFADQIIDQLHKFGVSEPLRVPSNSMEFIHKPNSMNDIEWFVYLVANGLLYEYLKKKFSERLDVNFVDRKSVKSAVFQVLFTDNRFIGQEEAAPKRIFKENFPQVYKLFSLYKRSDASLFPRLLQQIESRLILDVICPRILKERPGIPILTIHDSIATTIPNLEYVKGVMYEELFKHIGIEPNFKFEYWNKNKVIEKYPELYLHERAKLQA
jgi:hypothetical protein